MCKQRCISATLPTPLGSCVPHDYLKIEQPRIENAKLFFFSFSFKNLYASTIHQHYISMMPCILKISVLHLPVRTKKKNEHNCF